MKKLIIIKMLLLSAFVFCQYTKPMNNKKTKKNRYKKRKKSKNKHKIRRKLENSEILTEEKIKHINKIVFNKIRGIPENLNLAAALPKNLNRVDVGKFQNLIKTIKTKSIIESAEKQVKKKFQNQKKRNIFLSTTSDQKNILLTIMTAELNDAKKRFDFIKVAVEEILPRLHKNSNTNEKKAFLNAQLKSNGNTALMIALKKIYETSQKEEYTNIAKILIQFGADITIADNYGNTTFKLIAEIKEDNDAQEGKEEEEEEEEEENQEEYLFDLLLRSLKDELKNRELRIEGLAVGIENMVKNNYKEKYNDPKDKSLEEFLDLNFNKNANYRKTIMGKAIMEKQTYIPIKIIELLNVHFNRKIDIYWFYVAISATNKAIIKKLQEKGVLIKHGNNEGQKNRDLLETISRHCEGSVRHTLGVSRNTIEESQKLTKFALEECNSSLLPGGQYNASPAHSVILHGNLFLLKTLIQYSKERKLKAALGKKCQHRKKNHPIKERENYCEYCNCAAGKNPVKMLLKEEVNRRGNHRNRDNDKGYPGINIKREMLPALTGIEREPRNRNKIQKHIYRKLYKNNYNILQKITHQEELTGREIKGIITPIVAKKMAKIILKTKNKNSGKTLTELFLSNTKKSIPEREPGCSLWFLNNTIYGNKI